MNSQKRFLLLRLCALFSTVLLSAALLPLEVRLTSDVVYSGKLITALLYYFDRLLENVILALLVCLLAAGDFVFLSENKLRTRNRVCVFLIAAPRYPIGFCVTLLDVGLENITGDDLLTPLISYAVDAAILAAVLLISASLCRKYGERTKILEKAYRQAGKPPYDGTSEFFPYRRFLMPKTVVAGPIFWGAVLSAVPSFLSSLYFDLTLGGLPHGADDIIEIVRQYLGIVLVAVLCYTFGYFLSHRLISRSLTENTAG